jgi:hypothetical protein
MSTQDGAKGGHRRPPNDGRFEPGRSGNPRGRPKGVRNLRSDFTETLKKRVRIREDGELRYVSRQEAILLNLCARALQGDTNASGQLLARWAKLEFHDASPSQSKVTTDNDRAIVEEFLRRNKETASVVTGAISTGHQTAADASTNDNTTGVADDEKGTTP